MPSAVPIDVATVRKAEDQIESCEGCNRDASMPFEWILDRLTDMGPNEALYILETSAKCPKCGMLIKEKTLIEWGTPE